MVRSRLVCCDSSFTSVAFVVLVGYDDFALEEYQQ